MVDEMHTVNRSHNNTKHQILPVAFVTVGSSNKHVPTLIIPTFLDINKNELYAFAIFCTVEKRRVRNYTYNNNDKRNKRRSKQKKKTKKIANFVSLVISLA